MSYPTCRHCGVLRADDPGCPGLCQECADLAVWGAACPECGKVPTGRENESDYRRTMKELAR